jgi:DNA-binding MarR family transcriptional regulator
MALAVPTALAERPRWREMLRFRTTKSYESRAGRSCGKGQGERMRTFLGTLSRAHNLLEQALDATIIETGLSASELLVMQVAFEADEPSVGVILRSTGLRPSTLSSLLKRLERRGYIKRVRGSRDGRSRLIAVTLPGQQATRIAWSLQLDLERKLGEPERMIQDLDILHAIAREISLLAPPAIDPEDGLPIATA